MSHTPHELAEEFPGSVDLIHRLKLEDAHFLKLSEQYHEINRAIHRAETLVEPVSEDHEVELRRKRLALKDEIARLLKDAVT
ncbi:YdcH family protein [Roseinatronobacter sp. NSM]|uniref:YdcH family protein n=1 Tax=Roseinatronobacter sp. NSM TaxID=3457785 RepID=UPI004036AEBE